MVRLTWMPRLKLAELLAKSFKTYCCCIIWCKISLSKRVCLSLVSFFFPFWSCVLSVGPVGRNLLAGREWKSSLVHLWCSPAAVRADSLHGPLSPALPGGLRPAQGPLCDVGCPIKADTSCIPRPSFPLSLYLSQRWLSEKACQRIRFQPAHTDCLKTKVGRNWSN